MRNNTWRAVIRWLCSPTSGNRRRFGGLPELHHQHLLLVLRIQERSRKCSAFHLDEWRSRKLVDDWSTAGEWYVCPTGFFRGKTDFFLTGPCNINYDSNTTTLNPWSWNNEVNMYVSRGGSEQTMNPRRLFPHTVALTSNTNFY